MSAVAQDRPDPEAGHADQGTHQLPPKPEPMPPNPGLRRRIARGLRSSLDMVHEASFTLGGVGRHPCPQLPTMRITHLYTVREPELIREVLVERSADFPKSRLMQTMLGDLIGSSVFVTNGETWRWRRAIVDQALEQARVREVMALMRGAADDLIIRIDQAIDEAERCGRDGAGAVIRIDAEMTHFAADVIFRTLFSEPVEPRVAARIIAEFEIYQKLAYSHGILKLARVPTILMPSSWRRRLAAMRIRGALKQQLDRRLKAIAAGDPTPDGDIVATLITGQDPKTGRRMDRKDLIDEVCMFFLAGHETSASGLGWALYLLAVDQQTQEALRREAGEVLGERAPEFRDMRALEKTRDVFREALRLYPPVAQLARDSACPARMADRDVSAGEVVFATPWLMHRQGRFWSDPDAFCPGRFATEAGREAARQVYFPFSMGPRVCPGAAFALQEASLALAMLMRRFRFDPIEGRVPRPVARLTLRSANGVWLRARRV